MRVDYYEAGRQVALPVDYSDRFLPYKVDWVSEINYQYTDGNFAGSGKSKNVLAVFEGLLRFPSEGTWTMYTASDDGSKLYVDGQLVVNNNGIHNTMVEKSGTIVVDKSALGKWIRLEYFNDVGKNGLILRWEGPNRPKTVIRGWNFDPVGYLGTAAFYFILPVGTTPPFLVRVYYLAIA